MEDESSQKDRDEVSLGSVKSLDLGFSDIYMEITTSKKSKASKRVVLDGSIKGRAQPGRMLAIMGPSGAGSELIISGFH